MFRDKQRLPLTTDPICFSDAEQRQYCCINSSSSSSLLRDFKSTGSVPHAMPVLPNSYLIAAPDHSIPSHFPRLLRSSSPHPYFIPAEFNSSTVPSSTPWRGSCRPTNEHQSSSWPFKPRPARPVTASDSTSKSRRLRGSSATR